MIESFIDRLTSASVRFKWVTIGLAILALVAGIFALTQLKQELIPPIEFPQTVVLAFNSGMEPEAMRDEVTIPIEDAVKDIEGVVNIESTTASGMAFVMIQSEFGLDQEAVRTEIEEAVMRLTYPQGMETPELLTFWLEDLPLTFTSVSSELSTAELKALVESAIVPALQEVQGVADVQVSGGQELPTEPPPTPEPTATSTLEPTAEPTLTPTLEPTPTAEPTATTTEGSPPPTTEAGTGEPVAESEPVALPDSWIQAGAAQGITLTTTADLTPEMVAAIASTAPQMLEVLTPEMLLAMPLEALAALPADYLQGLNPELQAQLAERLAPAEEEETEGPTPTAEPTRDPAMLPDAWQSAGASQGISLVMPEDVTPEIIQGIAGMAPQLLDMLTPESLSRFSPKVLAWLPAEYIEQMDPDLRTKLDEVARPAGGLGTLAADAEEKATELATGAPELSGAWRQPPAEGATNPMPTLETAADLIENGFADTAAELLNMLVESNIPQAPDLLADLTPEVITWLTENEEGFLENINPAVLRLLSPEVLASLPGDFYATLAPELRTELEGIATGTVKVFVPEDTITCVDGKPSLRLTVYKDSEANTVATTHALFDRMAELESEYPGLRFNVTFEQASFVEESISGVTREGILGAIFAVVVILLFLSGTVGGRYRLSWRSTLVTAVSIPLSVFMAFALLKWLPPVANVVLEPLVNATDDISVLGAIVLLLHRMFPVDFTLNIMTLSGMTVAVGRVVDDSIVVLENIYRHIQRGEDRKQAVLVGTRDVSIAILASTVTTAIVFVPIGLVGGIVGQLFLSFGITVAYALGASFLIAVTVVPLLAYLFIRAEHLPEEKGNTLQRWYTPALRWALRNRAIVLVAAGLFFVGSGYLLVQQPRTFLPDLGEVQISANVDLPSGVTMAETADLVSQFEAALDGVEGLGTRQCEIGASGGLQAIASRTLGMEAVDQSLASISISIEDGKRKDELTAIVRQKAEQVFGAEYVTVSGGALTSSVFASFSLVLSGDPEQLATINDEVLAALERVDGLTNVTSDLDNGDMILRVNGQPSVGYSGEIETQDVMGVSDEAKTRVEAIVPTGIMVSEGYETEVQKEGFAQAIQALLISIVVVYLVMVITFRSFVHPFTILFSLPLAIVGAALALWLTGRVVGLPALVGLMMLVGIVVTNAIVLIDRVQANRNKQNMDAEEALVEGGRTRLRPILMTAVATILALTPLALGLTEGALVAAELATVVIGGLFTSTLLTLLIVPVMYKTLDPLTSFGRKQTKKAETPPTDQE